MLIGRGLTNQEIAAELSLGLNTVKTYIRTAYRRIGVESRARAIIWTFTHGLVAVQGVGTPAPRPGASTVR